MRKASGFEDFRVQKPSVFHRLRLHADPTANRRRGRARRPLSQLRASTKGLRSKHCRKRPVTATNRKTSPPLKTFPLAGKSGLRVYDPNKGACVNSSAFRRAEKRARAAKSEICRGSRRRPIFRRVARATAKTPARQSTLISLWLRARVCSSLRGSAARRNFTANEIYFYCR